MKYLKELEVEQKTKKSQAANNKPPTEPKKKPANNSGNSTRTSGESTVKITGNYVSDKEPIITNVIPCICPLQVRHKKHNIFNGRIQSTRFSFAN